MRGLTMRSRAVLLLWLSAVSFTPAADAVRLVVQPETVTLHGSLDRCQALATLEQDGPRDRTVAAAWRSADPKVATVEAGFITPRGNGSTAITAIVGNYRASVVVTVGGMDAPPAVSFRREVMAALSV